MEHCASDNGDGCGGFFPHKTLAGLCAKCRKIATLADGSTEQSQWKGMRQCVGCGLAWKNLQAELCGGCLRLESGTSALKGTSTSEHHLVRTAVDASRLAQADALDARLHKQPPPSALHTTSGLASAQLNATPTGDTKIFISVQCRLKSSSRREQSQTDLDCSQWGKPWAKADYLSEVLDDPLETLNNRWSKEHKLDLIRDEVEFRWSGNKVFLPNTANNTVGQVYMEYLTGDMAAFYSQHEAKGKRGSGPKNQLSMALELYVDKPTFMIHLKKFQAGRKRSATVTSLLGEDVPGPKRHAIIPSDDLCKSSFVRTSRETVAASTASNTVSSVSLEKAYTTCDVETGQVEIIWPENAEIFKGFLAKALFASGATKHVYQLTMDSELFVAKKFFEIGSDDSVTAD